MSNLEKFFPPVRTADMEAAPPVGGKSADLSGTAVAGGSHSIVNELDDKVIETFKHLATKFSL